MAGAERADPQRTGRCDLPQDLLVAHLQGTDIGGLSRADDVYYLLSGRWNPLQERPSHNMIGLWHQESKNGVVETLLQLKIACFLAAISAAARTAGPG